MNHELRHDGEAKDNGDAYAPVLEHGHSGPVAVLVVDDSEPVRQALREVVEAAPGFVLAGCAGSGEEGLQVMPRLTPDLVLLDVQMPGMGGAEAARQILDRHPEVVVVLVSAHVERLSAAAEESDRVWTLPKHVVSPRSLSNIWADARERAGEARHRAHALSEDAEALKAQANQQVRRARQNRKRHRVT